MADREPIELGRLASLIRDEPGALSWVLAEAGIPDDVAERLIASGDAEEAMAAVESFALGAGPAARPADVYEALEGSEAQVRRLWRSMGFVDLPDDEPSLREADLDALTRALEVLDVGGLTEEALYQQARTIGRSVSRIADAQVAAIIEAVRDIEAGPSGGSGSPDGEGRPASTPALVAAAVGAYLPVLESLLTYMYRRHLVAATDRALVSYEADRGRARARPASPTSTEMVVGFADIVGYSVSSLQLGPTELAALLDEFEATAADVVASHGGRVVKMIGDEVMFVAGDPDQAAAIALGLVDAFRDAGPSSQIRAGLSVGQPLVRQGDYYGPPVNLASRLVGIARPGTVLIDRELRDLLDASTFFTKSIRPRELKGVGYQEPCVLRHARQP